MAMAHASRLRIETVPGWVLATALGVLMSPLAARAEQFVLVDLSYTHSAETTGDDSHYYPKLPANTPKDWTKPVDYAHGEVHIVLDVKTKPAGDAPTKYQLCFEGTPSYGCTTQSPTYTKAGRVEWSSPFSSFWFDGTVDWSQGVKAMPMILKDDNNNKPAGDPKYMPTDLHVYVALVPAGEKFVPPSASAAGSGGSTGMAGARAGAGGSAEAGRGGAGGSMASGGAGASAAANGGSSGASNSTKPASGGAGAGSSPNMTKPAASADAGKPAAAAGSGGSASQTAAATASSEVSPKLENSSGCSAAGHANGPGAWAWLLAVYLGWARRRRLMRLV